MSVYRIEVGLQEHLNDPAAAGLRSEMKNLGLTVPQRVRTARLFWVEGSFSAAEAQRLARELFSDPLVEIAAVNQPVYDSRNGRLIEVVRKPGVMDPVAGSIRKALADRGLEAQHITTGRKYLFYYDAASPEVQDELLRAARKILANECIEEIYIDREAPVHAPLAGGAFKLVTIALAGKSDAELLDISKRGCLSLSIPEMKQIQAHYANLKREPTDIELETIAQTWSEHCRHKTMRGTIDFDGPQGHRRYENLLKETIVCATEAISHPKCLSVFKDNAGIVAFDDKWALTFKVETHNHPSAIEPYGGAGTGIGGVIRDTMGTGLGAKPIANTDVFCFGMPDTPQSALPAGTLHPKRVMAGVVAGVRDYGNRMGIPTLNGAVQFDPRYVGNPLVFCGSIGLLPRHMIQKASRGGDLIVVLGGRTGRDGIHGATFSSIELSENSEMVSSGAVQIGNAIEEKKVLDVLLKARDANLFTCVTDCGAGGLSSAVGEMAEGLGATVDLDTVPLKYAGLSYTEIWISEAQERMVIAVPPGAWKELKAMCDAEEVEGTVIGMFATDGVLRLRFNGTQVAEMDMAFLHGGVPQVVRPAKWSPPKSNPLHSTTIDMVLSLRQSTGLDADTLAKARKQPALIYGPVLRKILADPTVASKQWIIRQYDHEVQGGTVLKPLVGINDDGPGDAAVVAPLSDSTRGFAVGCGLCPQYTDRNPREMAKLAVDECMRNLVAVGADPANVFILDNFAWGNTAKPEQLGSLVLCCEGATEAAIAYGTPFISGKDSLNNEYTVGNRTIAVPGTLLISGLGIVDDVRQCVTMDLKTAGNLLYLVGMTRDELGGGHLNLVTSASPYAGNVPVVNLETSRETFKALHKAITRETVRACHDLSEGGLAVAVAEMAFAGGLGARLNLEKIPVPRMMPPHVVLFSESPSRFLVEVAPDKSAEFETLLGGIPHACIGAVTETPTLQCLDAAGVLWINEPVAALKAAWQTSSY